MISIQDLPQDSRAEFFIDGAFSIRDPRTCELIAEIRPCAEHWATADGRMHDDDPLALVSRILSSKGDQS